MLAVHALLVEQETANPNTVISARIVAKLPRLLPYRTYILLVVRLRSIALVPSITALFVGTWQWRAWHAEKRVVVGPGFR